jgi:RHS repeat-associated protein
MHAPPRLATAAAIMMFCGPGFASAQTETVEYYALDAIGSVRVVFDVNGNVIGRMDYDPFGAPLASGTGLPSRAYAGLFRDGEAGLDFAQARSYQVRTGRFSTVDLIYAGLFEPQAWNRYAYALNRPMTHVDPGGLNAKPNTNECTAAIRAMNPNDWHCGGALSALRGLYEGYLASSHTEVQLDTLGIDIPVLIVIPAGNVSIENPGEANEPGPGPGSRPDAETTTVIKPVVREPDKNRLDAFIKGCGQGIAAMVDSALPVFDPLSSFYDEDTPGIQVSREIGGPALQYMAGFGVARGVAYGVRYAPKGTWAYSVKGNPTMRIGYSMAPHVQGRVPRIAIGASPHPERLHLRLDTPTFTAAFETVKKLCVR